MLKELKIVSKHTLIYGFGIVLGKAIGFFMIPLYTHYLNPEEYGLLELVDVTGFIFGYFLVVGIDEAIIKFHNETEEQKEKEEYISTSLIFVILLGFVSLAILLPFKDTFAYYVLGSAEHSNLFAILFLSLCLGSSVGLTKSIIRAQQKSMFFVGVTLIAIFLQVTLNIYFVAYLQIGVEGILYSSLIVAVLFGVMLTGYMLRITGLRFNTEKLKEMLKYGIPLVPAGIMAFVLNWSDRYFLRIFVDMEEIGVYSLGYKLGMISTFFITMPFSFIWGSYIFEIKNKHNAKEVYAKIATYFLLMLSFAGLALSSLSYELVTVIADESYIDAYKVIPIIVLSMIFANATTVFKVGLLLEGRTIQLSIANSMAAVINVPLNIMLIPEYGMMGAAYATALSFLIYISYVLYAAQKYYHINFEYLRLAKIGIIIILLYNLSLQVDVESMWYGFLLKTAIVSMFPLLLYVANFYHKEELDFVFSRVKSVFGHKSG